MGVAAWQIWLGLALLLGLAELAGAHFIMLGLGLAAAVVAIVAAVVPEIGLAGQLLVFAVAAAFIVPTIILVFRRYFPESQISVMNEPGSQAAEPHWVVERDGRAGVEIYGDFYPAEFSSGLAPEPGMQVEIVEFRGIVALVRALDAPE